LGYWFDTFQPQSPINFRRLKLTVVVDLESGAFDSTRRPDDQFHVSYRLDGLFKLCTALEPSNTEQFFSVVF